jgi:serine/threonine-protein kinase
MIAFDELKQQFTSFNDHHLARGGQKEVYKAVHPKYGDVVVKVLFKYGEREKKEIDIVKVNQFDHVPTIFDVVDANFNGSDTTVIIEQFIDGQELRDIIKSGNKYGLIEATTFLEQSLRIINNIWKRGIVHRDIKPENIKIGKDHDVYFLDFGIARDLRATSITNSWD